MRTVLKRFWPLAVGVLALGAVVAGVAYSRQIPITKNIEYGRSDGVPLLLDLARPRSGAGPFPAVVCIHGGAWQAGNKRDMEHFIRRFAQAGYVAVSIEYRMAPKYQWPVEMEDSKCAVRYLRAHAKELNIAPANIFATGASAGGHLALLLGLMEAKDGLEGDGGSAGESSAVRGVANFFGPTDFTVWNVANESDDPDPAKKNQAQKVLEAFLGTSDRHAPVIAQASPITYVRASNPPILSFQGDRDDIVPAEQAKLLHAALEKAGVQNKLEIVAGEGHGWGGTKLEESFKESIAFFDAIRNGKAPGQPSSTGAGAGR